MTRTRSSIYLLKNVLRSVLWTICFYLSAGCAAAAPLDVPAAVQSALEENRNGRFREALDISRKLQTDYPQHPLPFLVTAEIFSKMIYFQTGRINSQEVRNFTDTKSSPYDNDFFRAVETALALSETMRRKPETATTGTFYSGLAHGAKSRLFTLRAQSRRAVAEAKQMRTDLLEAIAEDASLAPDAYLGLGAYNYYTDALSSLLKVLRILMGIPGGDRVQGLAQLQTASEKAALWSAEAKYELAHIYAVREGRTSMALSLFRELMEQYPGNPLYALLSGLQAEKLGQPNVAITYYRKAEETAAKMDTLFGKHIVDAAKQALERTQKTQSIQK